MNQPSCRALMHRDLDAQQRDPAAGALENELDLSNFTFIFSSQQPVSRCANPLAIFFHCRFAHFPSLLPLIIVSLCW